MEAPCILNKVIVSQAALNSFLQGGGESVENVLYDETQGSRSLIKKIEIKDRPQLSIAWDTNHRPSVTNQKLNLNRRRLGHARFPALQAVCLVLLLLVIIFFF